MSVTISITTEVACQAREFFDNHSHVPEARHVPEEPGKHFGKEKAARKFLRELFHYGYGQQARKIPGMRNPRKRILDV